jgi:predicted metal-dependent peptidase
MITSEERERLEKMISASMLRVRFRSPFFATLALYARFYPSESIPTAAGSGLYDIHYNSSTLIRLSPRQQDAIFLHHVLHLSLLHHDIPLTCSVPLWNYAADIIVNGVIAKQEHIELLPGAVRNKELEDKPIAEIYEILLKKGWDKDQLTHGGCFSCDEEILEAPQMLTPQERTERRAYWNQAMRQALLVQRTQSGGHKLPEWLEELAAQIEELNEDWRGAMWRFLVKTPADFDGFDRRMVSQGFYLEETRIDQVQVIFGVDATCGVDREQWSIFVTEAVRVIAAYPHLQPSIVFQNEQKLFGPFDPREVPSPYTTKRVDVNSFWEYANQVVSQSRTPTICVYLTDGFGQSVPEVAPNISVLWLVVPGGRRLDKFPFGRAVRFLRFG